MSNYAIHIETSNARKCQALCMSKPYANDLSLPFHSILGLTYACTGPCMEDPILMHTSITLPCFRSAINTWPCTFKYQPYGDLKLCWNQNLTSLKGIPIFISQFQAWISTQLVDLQVLFLSLAFISHLKIKLEAKVWRNRVVQSCSSKV